MHKSPFHIRFISMADIPQVEHLLALQFGNGFMDATYLIRFVDQPGYGGWVATHGESIVGVALALAFPIDAINEHVHVHADQIQAIFPVQNQIGMAKLMATMPAYTGRGIGLELMAERMKWFELNCEAVISMCWEESNGGAAKLLTRNGFKNLMTIPAYWKEESLNTPFDCARCGSPPCLCTGSLYVKYFE